MRTLKNNGQYNIISPSILSLVNWPKTPETELTKMNIEAFVTIFLGLSALSKNKIGLKKITQAQRAGKTPTGGRGAAGRKTRRATTKKRTAAKPVKPTGSVKGAAGRRARRNQLKTGAAGAGAVIGAATFLPKKPKQPTQPK